MTAFPFVFFDTKEMILRHKKEDAHFLFFMSKVLLTVAARQPFARSYLLQHKARWDGWLKEHKECRDPPPGW